MNDTRKARYSIYDTTTGRYLVSFKKPVKGCDAAVTRWSPQREFAMKFRGVKSAKCVAMWLDCEKYGGCVVLNGRWEIV